MIYRIKFTKGMISRLASQGHNKDVEIIIDGQVFVDYDGKSSWSGTGGARNAIRNKLNRSLWDMDNDLSIDDSDFNTDRDYLQKMINEIMKTCVGTDPSFPIYLKQYR